jgi:hypothetical protein
MRIKANHWLVLSILMVIAIFSTPLKISAQTQVTGTVMDESRETLPGVSVKVKNGSAAVNTDANGKFSIQAEAPMY